MMLNKLNLSIEATTGKVVGVCEALQIRVEADHIHSLFSNLEDAIDDRLFDLYETGEIGRNELLEALAGESEWENGDGFVDWLETKRYERHRKQLNKAFLDAYPKASNQMFPHMSIPFHDFESVEWDKAKELAQIGLIKNGSSDKDWIKYCQIICANKFFGFVPDQKYEWYQRQIDLGLPVLPVRLIEQIYAKKGWDMFDLDSWDEIVKSMSKSK